MKSDPKFVQARNTFTARVESTRMHADVCLHVLHVDGETVQITMPLSEALAYIARWTMECKAISIWPA